jgi:hypothetical protein
LVINQKYKRNISIHRKRRYDQPRATFGWIAMTTIIFSLWR